MSKVKTQTVKGKNQKRSHLSSPDRLFISSPPQSYHCQASYESLYTGMAVCVPLCTYF